MIIRYGGPIPNYSISIFFIAREAKLSKELKTVIANRMTNIMLGRKALTPDSTEKEICEAVDAISDYDDYERTEKRIKKALKQGKSIYVAGTINDGMFGLDNHIDLYLGLWEVLARKEPDCIIQI